MCSLGEKGRWYSSSGFLYQVKGSVQSTDVMWHSQILRIPHGQQKSVAISIEALFFCSCSLQNGLRSGFYTTIAEHEWALGFSYKLSRIGWEMVQNAPGSLLPYENIDLTAQLYMTSWRSSKTCPVCMAGGQSSSWRTWVNTVCIIYIHWTDKSGVTPHCCRSRRWHVKMQMI